MKTTMKYQYTLIRMENIFFKLSILSVGGDREQIDLYIQVVGMQMLYTATLENSLMVSYKVTHKVTI